MKLYFLCDNIKGFDVHIKSIDGRFRRDLYLPRGEHAAYMETMEDLSRGFVMTMSGHVKDPENDYRVRTVLLDAINYDFERAKGGKLGDKVSGGKSFAYDTLVESLPEDTESVYIRFVRMSAAGACAPEVVAIKTFGSSRITAYRPPMKHNSNSGEIRRVSEMSVDLSEKRRSVAQTKKKGFSIESYQKEAAKWDDLYKIARDKVLAEKMSEEYSYGTDLSYGESENGDYGSVGSSSEPSFGSHDNDFSAGHTILRILTMTPVGIMLVVAVFMIGTNPSEDLNVFGDTLIDKIISTVFYNMLLGFVILGGLGLNLIFRPFVKTRLMDDFMTSTPKTILAIIFSTIVFVAGFGLTMYGVTEGGFYASTTEKADFEVFREKIWDTIHISVDKHGYDVWEVVEPPIKQKVYVQIADHRLNQKQADDSEKNMACEMIFRARNNFFKSRVWAYADRLSDAEELAISRYKVACRVFNAVSDEEYKASKIEKYLNKHKKTIKKEVDEYAYYEAEIGDGIEIYIEDYSYWDEEDESDGGTNYLVEIIISGHYDPKRIG